MDSRNTINTLQRASFAFMAFMVYLFNYSNIPVLKSITNISVLVFIAFVLVPTKESTKISKAFLFYYFFLASCSFSILISTSMDDSIHKLGTLLLLQFEFIAIYNFVSKERTFDFAYSIIAICTIIVAITTIMHAPAALQTAQRVGYVTGDSNQSSAYLVYGTLILLLYYSIRKKSRWIYITGIVSSILAIVLQGSRTSTVVVGIVLLIEIVLLMRYENAIFTKRVRTFCIFLLSLTAVFILIMNSPTLYRTLGRRLVSFYEIQTTNQSSINETSTFNRLAAYDLAFKRFLASPMFGNGLASFADYSEPFLGRAGFCPNNYLELLQGIGLIGTIFYYLIYIYIIRTSYAMFKHRDGHYSVLVISVIIAMLLEHLSVVFYYHKLEYLFLGTLLATCSHRSSVKIQRESYIDRR